MSRILLASSLLLLACGSTAPRQTPDAGGALDGGADGGPDGGGQDGGSLPGDGGTPIAETLSVHVTGQPLAGGQERTFCVVQRLSNAAPGLVHQVSTTLSSGSHHLVIYRTDETQERTTPFECFPFVEIARQRAVPLMISQIPSEQLTFPENVVFEMAPHQMVRIEAHYLNTTASTLNPEVSVSFETLPDAPGLQRADFLFLGTIDIDLPPNVPTTVGPRFIKGLPQRAKIFAMTTHTHQWGTQFRVQKSTSRSDPGTAIYDYPNWAWDEPPVKRFEPHLTFNSGEGVRFTCEYLNRSSRRVGFGESAEDEMCFLWLYYYPSAGYRICIDTDYQSQGEICCPGDFRCGFVDAFLGGL